MEPGSRCRPRVRPAAVSISLDDPRWCRAVREPVRLARRAAVVALRLARARGRLTVALADDAALHGLNRQFRGRDHATNVLSFPAAAGLGDVIVSRAAVVREARREGVGKDARLAHLVLHGVLHVCGFDHASAREARSMELAEAACMRRLGLPNPWRRQG